MADSTAGAIVIGRDYGALGVIRSLGRRDIPVWLLEEATSNASVSRYLKGRMPWPERETEQLALLSDLATRRALAGWTLFPTSDEASALIARHHARLARHFKLTTPDWETMRWAYDKRLTYQI